MNLVTFLVRGRVDGAIEIVPAVDDAALTDLVDAFEASSRMEPRGDAYGGLIPAHFNFGPLELHFLGSSRWSADGRVPLLGCSCGEWGCWPLLARIVCTPDFVMWTDFQQPHRKRRDYTAFGPFHFARAQYEDALAGALAGVPAEGR